MKQLLVIFFFVCSFNCFSQNDNSKTNEEEKGWTTIRHDEFDISIIRLIATPEKYDGKIVQIIGFLNLEFEGNAIYLHKEDFQNALTRNSMWVSFSPELDQKKNFKDYNKRYVIIVGRFNMNKKGHMGMFGGSIENITRLESWNFTR